MEQVIIVNLQLIFKVNMKKLLLFLLFLGWAGGAWANTWTFVGGTCAASTNGSSVTTPAINMTGATVILLAYSCAPGVSCSGTVTDSGSNTWTYITGGYLNAGNVTDYAISPNTSASQTFTVTLPASSIPSICVEGFNGGTGVILDKNNVLYTASSSTAHTGSITPTLNNELIVSFVSSSNVSPSSIDSSFTIPSGGTTTLTVNAQSLGEAYYIQSTAGATNPTWTMTGSGNNTATIASFEIGTSSKTNNTFFGDVVLNNWSAPHA
jgi:hypothetical protein